MARITKCVGRNERILEGESAVRPGGIVNKHDHLPTAQSTAELAISKYVRFPTTENHAWANRALQRLRLVARRLCQANLRQEQVVLAQSLRCMTPTSGNDR